MTILEGVKILEIEGIGPTPFAGMLLADLGAEVIVIERHGNDAGLSTQIDAVNILKRGKKSIALNLKEDEAVGIVLDLLKDADGLIEGMRPGVMERLGLGPDVCHDVNPCLVYGRVTGWGQEGPLAHGAGHDPNYIALSGALWYAGQAGNTPVSPPTLLGDVAGGALYLTIGMLAGFLNARSSGKGHVVDAAIVDGSAHMMNLLFSLLPAGLLSFERGKSFLDGPHWFDNYECSDGNYISLGALEPQFYEGLISKLGLSDDLDFKDQYDPQKWPEQKEKFRKLFLSKSRDEWCELLEGADACFAPILTPEEAARHPHNVERNIFHLSGDTLQAASAPRFKGQEIVSSGRIATRGEDTEDCLRGLGKSEVEIAALRAAGIIP